MKRTLSILAMTMMVGGVPALAQQTEAPQATGSNPLSAEPVVDPCPFLGVYQGGISDAYIQQLNVPSDHGAIVWEVICGTSADTAGLKKLDVIVSYNGQPIDGSDELRKMVADSKPGERVDLGVVRDGETRTVVVDRLGSRRHCLQQTEVRIRRVPMPDDPAQMPSIGEIDDGVRRQIDEAEKQIRLAQQQMQEANQRLQEFKVSEATVIDQKRIGATVQTITPQLADYFGVTGGRTGALVSAVSEDAPAERGGLQVGDVVTRIDDQGVANPGDLERAVASKHGKVTLHIIRQRQAMTVVVDLGDSAGQSSDGAVDHDADLD